MPQIGQCVNPGRQAALHSNRALASIIEQSLTGSPIPKESVQLVPTVDREALNHLLTLDQQVHCIIPRGGEGLIRFVAENSRIPVIKHYKGVCNLFVDAEANLDMAKEIAVSSKCGRPGVCNAIENLIVDEKVAPEFLPRCARELVNKGCQLIVDGKAASLLGDFSTEAATDEHYEEEFLDLRLSIKAGVTDDAIFVNRFGSGYSESIITEDKERADRFLRKWTPPRSIGTSTRFTDGFEFGLGAEIGISTDRLHARGPMGLEELCTYKCGLPGRAMEVAGTAKPPTNIKNERHLITGAGS